MDFWGKICGMYEYKEAAHEVSHSYLKPSIDKMVPDVPIGSTVLDLGCGNGSFISMFRDRAWKLYGTDFSESGIRIAQETYPYIRFVHADSQTNLIEELEGKVDVILSTEVIEHVYDPRAFLKTAYRYLKPSGKFIVTTPYHGYLKNLVMATRGMDSHFTVLWDGGHIKFWSKKTLSQAMTETGFTNLEFMGSGRAPYLWKSMIMSGLKTSRPTTQAIR